MAEETQDGKKRDEWKPPDDMVPDNQSTSSWKSAWKQVIIKVMLENGKEIGNTDATGTLMPVKMQFLMTNHRNRLEPVIKGVSSLQISKIIFAEEFLEVIVKSEPPLAVISEIVNCLTNEFDEVILKTVPKLPFTLQMAEEVLQEQLAVKNIDLLEDNTTMFIVGFYDSKSLMNKLIEQITSSSVKKAVSLEEKIIWKTMALKRFGLLEQLSQKFHDVKIGLQEEKNCVYFQGRDIKVQEAINAMNKCLSSLLMKKIPFDPLVIELLTCSEASRLFCEMLEKENTTGLEMDTITEEVSKLKSEKAELETHIQHLEMKLKLVGKEGVATNNTADKNQEQIQHIDTSKQEARYMYTNK
ncbi:unnamed protein product [Mytilus coruscus]|uniref:Uncharacterized protein n=1 Tax=Mytilus coruscus TaxID=42192 RepID=A0A6J8CW96_MYTCO|nr:unnamed protein product [Mytilus coruscus]